MPASAAHVRRSVAACVGWLADIFCLDNSWTPVPSAVELPLQIFKQTQKLTFTVTKFLLISGPSSPPLLEGSMTLDHWTVVFSRRKYTETSLSDPNIRACWSVERLLFCSTVNIFNKARWQFSEIIDSTRDIMWSVLLLSSVSRRGEEWVFRAAPQIILATCVTSNRANVTVFITVWPWPLRQCMPSDYYRVYVPSLVLITPAIFL